jgi:group I intron endonuclease
MAVIYRITNMANDKFYIGSADSFARREWQHKYALKRGVHKNPHLQAAWNKYGEEMFVFEVVEELPAGDDQLQWEDKWLKDCVGKPNCYNVNTLATAPRLGLTLSEKTKQQLSESRKGKHAGEEHYRYGKTVSEETKAKIGNTQRGKPKAPGRKVSEEGRAKLRAAAAAVTRHRHHACRRRPCVWRPSRCSFLRLDHRLRLRPRVSCSRLLCVPAVFIQRGSFLAASSHPFQQLVAHPGCVRGGVS